MQKKILGWSGSSVIQHLPGICKDLNLVPNISRRKRSLNHFKFCPFSHSSLKGFSGNHCAGTHMFGAQEISRGTLPRTPVWAMLVWSEPFPSKKSKLVFNAVWCHTSCPSSVCCSRLRKMRQCTLQRAPLKIQLWKNSTSCFLWLFQS